ncbi:M50 family metallopeptidase [Janibacter alittae]|uniref:M50 family metallopeptidase n=1 Tax=Janibacter alittae TaxID=3115209 RepID=A0ABZ2MKQ9_9MICO
MDLLTEIVDRSLPAATTPQLAAPGLAAVLVVAGVAVTWWPAWRVLRLVVTLVHELGHAVVGVAVGRRFRGFVLRADMSGHAVTVGPPRGAGVVATTWAGYPAPAIVGALLVWVAAKGWAAPVLSALLAAMLVALLFVRSLLTALVVLVSLAAAFAVWWWRDDPVQQHVLVGMGLVLLVGAWRHLAAVLGHVEASSDPGVLARLTGLPVVVWQLGFVVVLGLASWVVVTEVLQVLR